MLEKVLTVQKLSCFARKHPVLLDSHNMSAPHHLRLRSNGAHHQTTEAVQSKLTKFGPS
jgi:hypothetical protein